MEVLMEYTIEKDIPLPEKRGRSKYPIRDMKKGDSFEINAPSVQNLREAIAQMKRREKAHKDKVFTVRKINNGYRCWRME